MYLFSIVSRVCIDGEWHTRIITDRSEYQAKDLNRPSEGTNLGPLASSDFVDIGSFGSLLKRAQTNRDAPTNAGKLTPFELTIAASVGHSARLIGTKRTF